MLLHVFNIFEKWIIWNKSMFMIEIFGWDAQLNWKQKL
jgi:hypothetical protein